MSPESGASRSGGQSDRPTRERGESKTVVQTDVHTALHPVTDRVVGKPARSKLARRTPSVNPSRTSLRARRPTAAEYAVFSHAGNVAVKCTAVNLKEQKSYNMCPRIWSNSARNQ